MSFVGDLLGGVVEGAGSLVSGAVDVLGGGLEAVGDLAGGVIENFGENPLSLLNLASMAFGGPSPGFGSLFGDAISGFAPEFAPLAELAGDASTLMPGESGGLPIDLLKKLGLGSNPWSTAFSIGSGIYGMSKARNLEKLAEQAANRQDPFGPYRPGYAAELQALRADPTRIERLPGYQAGLNAVQRKMAQQGYLGSGNMMAALQQYGGQAFDAEQARLAQLAGAQFAPSGGETLLRGAGMSADLASKSLGSLGYGIKGLNDLWRTANG